jgi:hypothetical protein
MIASPFKVHKQVILPDILRISGPLAYIRRIRGHFESQGRAFERLLNDKSCPIFGEKVSPRQHTYTKKSERFTLPDAERSRRGGWRPWQLRRLPGR